MKPKTIYTIIALLIFTPLVFANGNHEENSHHDKTYTNEYISENTYIEYKDYSTNYDRAIAAVAALESSEAEISHKSGHKSHQAIGFGVGAYNGSQALGVSVVKQTDCLVFKLNAAFSGSERVVGGGISISF